MRRMNERCYILFFAIALFLGGLGLPPGGPGAPTARASGGGDITVTEATYDYEKVVHVTWDGFYDELYGLAKAQGVGTPNLDRLVGTGMRLTNHLTVVPAVEAAKYSAMTGAYPRTTGNTYKYFDGANVVGQGSTVNLAQTITQAMQGERTALAINEAAVKSEEGDGFAYISTGAANATTFEAGVTEAVYALSTAGQPDYLNLYSYELVAYNREVVDNASTKPAYIAGLLEKVEAMDVALGELMDAVETYGSPERTVYVLSSHTGVTLTETKKISDLYNALTAGGFTYKEVSSGAASGSHDLVAIKNYEAKYMQLRFNALDPARTGDLVALLESQPFVEDVLERAELDAMGVHPQFADLLVVPAAGNSFNPATVGAKRQDAIETPTRVMFGVISGPKIEALGKVGNVMKATSIVDLAPTIAELLGMAAPANNEGVSLLTAETHANDNYVVYVNLDGFAYHWYELAKSNVPLPNFDELLANGVLFTDAGTGIPSITGAMQQAVVAGAWPTDTGNSYRYYDKELNQVFQYDRQNELENIAEAAVARGITIAGVNAWYFQNKGMVAGDPKKPYIEAGGTSSFTARMDDLVKIIRGEPVVSGGQSIAFAEVPRFLAIYGDDIDSVGHNEHDTREYETMSTSVSDLREAMTRTIQRVDTELGRLVQALKDRGIYDKTTIFLTTDHGMSMYGAESVDGMEPNPPTTSSLPDLLDVIASAGEAARGEPYKVESVFAGGSSAKADTEIVVTSVGLQAQVQFRIPMEKAEIERIVGLVQQKEYYDTHLYKEELMKRGAPEHFADLLISPKSPYNFKTGSATSQRAVRGQHDSLAPESQHIFTLISGEAVRHGITYDQKMHNINIAPMMARVLGFEGPSGATAGVIDEVLIGKYQGPALTLGSPASEDVTVASAEFTVSGVTAPNAAIKLNDAAAGKADVSGSFSATIPLTEGLNRIIVEAVADGRETRKVLFATYLVPREQLTLTIAEAKALLEEAVEGDETGQYKPGTKSVLRAAIVEATLVEEDIQAARGQLDVALAVLEQAIADFEFGKRRGAFHLFGELVLNGAEAAGTTVTLRSADGGTEYTAAYGEPYGTTSSGRMGVEEVRDAYGNRLDSRLRYYFDVPHGTYTITASSGTKTAARNVATASTTVGELPWGTYTLEKAQDMMLTAAYAGSDGKPFGLTDGQLTQNGGMQAAVTVSPAPAAAHDGTVVVVFQLLKGTVPAGVIAVEKEIVSPERVTAHFNVVGAGYRVKTFVVDRYNGDLTDVGSPLAEAVTLE